MGKQISLIARGTDRLILGNFLFENGYMIVDDHGHTVTCRDLSSRNTVFITRTISNIQYSKWGTVDQLDSPVIELSFGVVGNALLTGKSSYRPGRIYLPSSCNKDVGLMLKDYQSIARFIKSKCFCTYKLRPTWNVYVFPEAAEYINDNNLLITPNC